jgi:small subunit ribosomal protein S6
MAERVRDYECAVLFRPDVEPEQLDAEVETIRNLLTNRGAEIARVDRWNKRMLAYPIKDYTEGFYVIYRWYSTPEVLPELAYHFKFADNVLRNIVLDYTEKERKRRKRLGKNATKPVQAA